MLHTSWHIKQENQDKSELLHAAINAAYAIDQHINKKNSSNLDKYINEGIILIDLLIENVDSDDSLIDPIRKSLREIYTVNNNELNMKLKEIKESIIHKEYNKNQIDMFINIYKSVKNVKVMID